MIGLMISAGVGNPGHRGELGACNILCTHVERLRYRTYGIRVRIILECAGGNIDQGADIG